MVNRCFEAQVWWLLFSYQNENKTACATALGLLFHLKPQRYRRRLCKRVNALVEPRLWPIGLPDKTFETVLPQHPHT